MLNDLNLLLKYVKYLYYVLMAKNIKISNLYFNQLCIYKIDFI